MVVKIKTLNTEFDCIGGAVVAEGDRSTGVLLYYCLLHNGWLTQPGGQWPCGLEHKTGDRGVLGLNPAR